MTKPYFVIDNNDLLVLNNFEGIEILTPKDFVTKFS
jgi:predicted nucleic acid-binding protein